MEGKNLRVPMVAEPYRRALNLENIDANNKKKFKSRESERVEKYSKSRQQFGLNLTPDMVQPFFPENISGWPNSKIFLEPIYKKYILKALKDIIHVGTGVRQEYISIKAFYCTQDKDGASAWITMS